MSKYENWIIDIILLLIIAMIIALIRINEIQDAKIEALQSALISQQAQIDSLTDAVFPVLVDGQIDYMIWEERK